jgi:rare lipoprotein A
VSTISSLSRAGIGANHISQSNPSSCRVSGALRLLAVALAAATLAACAQQPPMVASRQAGQEPDRSRKASFETNRRVAVAHHAVSAAKAGKPAETKGASHGLASFYSYDPQTASGEKFDKNELTAAHRTLPFGTRLRVTDVATGRSGTVRVNDRGPFVRGRVVDVSASAAETLGITGKGVAKVKLDVVE